MLHNLFTDALIYALIIYALIIYALIIYALVRKKEELQCISYTKFITEVINIDFP